MSRPKRILVVDDEKTNCLLLDATLKSLGYETEIVLDGAEAVERLHPGIDLVLLDVMMPGLDGFEVTQRIRSHPTCGTVPVILLTVLDTTEDRLRSVAAGANDYITKPFDRTELQIRISSQLRMKETLDALSQSEEQYRTLVETCKDIIWTLDLDLNYTYISPAVTEVLGYTAEEIMSMSAVDTLAPKSREAVVKAFQEELVDEMQGNYRRDRSRTLEIEQFRKDGTTLWLQISANFLRNQLGHPVGILGVSHEMTKRKMMEEKLRQTGDELEKRVEERTADLKKLTEKLSQEIEERKRAEHALLNSEHLLRNILATSPIGISLASERRVGWCNDTWLKLFGYDHENQMIGQSFRVLYSSEEEYKRVETQLYDKLDSGKVTGIDATFVRADGSLFDGHIRIKALDKSNPDKGIIATIYDISDRKRAEEAQRQSEEKYRLVVEKAKEAIFILQNGRLHFVNPQMTEFLRYKAEELIAQPFANLIHPDDREAVMNSLAEGLSGEKSLQPSTFRVLDKEGLVRWAGVDSAVVTWEENPALLLFITDVTERLEMEAALKDSEEWYRTLVEKSFDGLLVEKGPKVVFANARLYEMLGYDPGELEGIDHWHVYHAQYQTITRERAAARLRGETVVPQYDVELQRKDGTYIDGEVSAKVITVQGEPGLAVWIRDISERKRSEAARRLLATAVEQAAEAMVITDSKGDIEYVNPAFEHISGYTREEVLGANAQSLKSEEHDPAFYQDLQKTLGDGGVWRGRLVNKKKDGNTVYGETTISPVRDPDGNVVHFVAVTRDMTEQVELSKQLFQAQKLEAVGTLAGGIAHDFNNLLQVTLGYSELLLADKDTDHPDYADLQKIHRAARNGADLVKHLLTFSRKAESQAVPVNLNRQINLVEKLLLRTIPKMIKIHLDLDENIKEINIDPTQMEQVLMNLALNARDAMPDGGVLTIETKNASLSEEFCRSRGVVGLRLNECVMLKVSDTGQGMDKTTLDHIFEPFYTTKELGRGTGLGLAVVYGVVEQHGGYISCSSESGKGTVFEIYLPALPNQTEIKSEEKNAENQQGTETILLVDDEDFLRELGARILTRAGYSILQAANGRQALEMVQKDRKNIDLVILDLIMPEMGGANVLAELIKDYPDIKVIIASGYSGQDSAEECKNAGAKGFVSKPFKIDELLKLVRTILDEN